MGWVCLKLDLECDQRMNLAIRMITAWRRNRRC